MKKIKNNNRKEKKWKKMKICIPYLFYYIFSNMKKRLNIRNVWRKLYIRGAFFLGCVRFDGKIKKIKLSNIFFFLTCSLWWIIFPEHEVKFFLDNYFSYTFTQNHNNSFKLIWNDNIFPPFSPLQNIW